MSTTCIVCLGELAGEGTSSSLPPASPVTSDDSGGAPTTPRASTKSPERTDAALELIAHLLPCGHDLHDECLKPWVERANSCPICRQSFNLVELKASIGGPVRSSYAVEDRTQVADVDPYLVVEDLGDEEAEGEPCPICHESDNEEELLLCDSCDANYHTYCIGLDSVPEGDWFCSRCEPRRRSDFHRYPQLETTADRSTTSHRTRAQLRRLRRNDLVNDRRWARVWQSVWDNLNFDLDFPFDDEHAVRRYQRAQRDQNRERREMLAWQRRYEVGQRQGGRTNMFNRTRPALLEPRTEREQADVPAPESQEELRAWNAWEKARDVEVGGSNKRKRKSASTSPTEPAPSEEPERKLKRPRTRRTVDLTSRADSMPDTPNGMPGPSGSNISRRSAVGASSMNGEDSRGGTSFLQSLLKEVETSPTPTPSEGQRPRPGPLASHTPSVDHHSPRPMSSPGSSPTSSNHPSPRALSRSPPPGSAGRPGSPVPLTSKVEPVYAPPEYSPSRSPAPRDVESRRVPTRTRSRSEHENGRSRPTHHVSPTASRPGSNDASPTRMGMSLTAKESIRNMVTAALKPLYRKEGLSTEQYTYVNRTVSRLLYDRIGDLDRLDQKAKEWWEAVAGDEVREAVMALKAA
ncbi:MAG: hypothetical protein M1817_001229 [Caeruleum heppii]|nr:MAG: hypothetical protein M1817_001229 [Caeruleum heppii]